MILVCRVGLWGNLGGDLGGALLARLETMASFDVCALQAPDTEASLADDDEEEAASILRFRRRALPICSLDDLATVDIVVLLAPWSPARAVSELAACQVIDLSPGARSVLPTWHVLPHPALDLSLRLLRALRSLSLCAVQICSHESVAMDSELATRELVKETIDLLNGRGRTVTTGQPQTAFNLWPLSVAEQMQLQEDLCRCLDDARLDLQLVRLRVPVFYGLWQVWSLRFQQPCCAEDLAQCLQQAGIELDDAVRDGPVAVLAEDEDAPAAQIKVAIQGGEDARHWVLYAAVDPLRFSQVENFSELLQTLEKLL